MKDTVIEKAGKYAVYEYERKFLVKKLPPAVENAKEWQDIEDTYLDKMNIRVRVMKDQDGKVIQCKLTQKYRPDASNFWTNVITNIYISEDEAQIFAALPGRVIKKKRYKLTRGIHTYSIDVFDEPKKMILAELEFETEDEAKKFTLPFPDWSDVTHDLKFTGGMIAAPKKT